MTINLLQRGRPVPVIIPPDCRRALSFLANNEQRKLAKIVQGNPYLFPNSGMHTLYTMVAKFLAHLTQRVMQIIVKTCAFVFICRITFQPSLKLLGQSKQKVVVMFIGLSVFYKVWFCSDQKSKMSAI